MTSPIEKLAIEISKCTACDERRIAVEHVAPMQRGQGQWGIIIGEGPGNKEVQSAEAFSGLAGKRLLSWFQEAGIAKTRDDMFRLFYMTSITKCRVKTPSHLAKAASTCMPFLLRQVQLIQPAIVITLGSVPLKFLTGYTGPLEGVVGKVYKEGELDQSLFPMFGSAPIIPLPHPSPLSRWTNESANKKRLALALNRIANLHKEWE